MNQRLLAVIVALVVCATFFLPLAVSAQEPIVPECSGFSALGNFTGACTLCDLIKLAQRLINFAVGFTTIVAALMFTYAGILYFTASTKIENIKKAHDIFVKVFAGLIIILSAWLIINIIMQTLYDEGEIGRPWQTIECNRYQLSGDLSASRPRIIGGVPGGGGGVEYDQEAEQSARTRLSQANVCISASGSTECNVSPCGDRSYQQAGGGCTNVGGLSDTVISQLASIRSRCNCDVVITGGTEGGHATHTGTQVDLRINEQLQTYLSNEANVQRHGIGRICGPTGNPARYRCSVNEAGHLHLEF